MMTPRHAAHVSTLHAAQKVSPAQQERRLIANAANQMCFADRSHARELIATATRDGRSWWEGLDRATLNRIAHERHPTCEGKLPQPNF